MDEVELLRAVQRLLKKAIPFRVVEGFEPDKTIPSRPIRGFGRDGGSGPDGRTHHAHHKPIRTRTAGRRAS
jgi:ATP-dependent RNA helicase RhlE